MSQAANPNPKALGAQKLTLALLIIPTLLVLADLLRWMAGQTLIPGLKLLSFTLCGLFFGLPLFQLAMSWYLSFRFRLRSSPPPPHNLSVDVFVTVVDEPLELVRRTLRAACAMDYPHRTYLLDDGGSSAFRQLAAELGARYIARPGSDDLKAGNVNHALTHSSGEVVAIFDVDHTPEPDFLTRTLGFFADPRIGFVQAMVTFSNQDEGLFAQASAQTAFDYYNISAVGKDRCGAASLMGSNAVIRRRALEEIGGYRPGLAEDLETSLALHGAGWRSAYVRAPLAPGLTPADLPAFLKQQLKWASGVFEAALGAVRSGGFFRLTLQQQLCYLLRFSNYLFGPLLCANMLLLAGILFYPLFDVEAFTLRLLPLTVLAWLSCAYPLRMWALEPAARRGFLAKGASLFASSWPVYSVAALSTLLRRRIPFIPTPKTASHRLPAWSFVPQLSLIALLTAAVLFRLAHWQVHPMPRAVIAALLAIAGQWILVPALLRGLRHRRRSRGRQHGLPRPAEDTVA